MNKLLLLLLFVLLPYIAWGQNDSEKATQTNSNPPIYIAFLWHMHQPIYWPGETVRQTDAANRYSYRVEDIHNQRTGPYTWWPKNAIQKAVDAGLANCGASVSFSGSLIENLNGLEAAGNGNFSNWKTPYRNGVQLKTIRGNPRLDMIGFGYYHPLMGLIEYEDIRRQIQLHKNISASAFGGTYSKGIFPPENAFSKRMIPALVDEGIQWALVDNVHFDRAAIGYPWTKNGNLYEVNKADQVNADPRDWAQLNGLWAPTKISAAWGHRPHFAEYVNPSTGQSTRLIVVPTSRYLGNEDGRGGFGALNYDLVMSQLAPYNTDPNHPILVVLHHDGDNYGGGSEGYYGGNFQSFVDWAKANPGRFQCTTIQDYLEQFPPNPSDVIHVEDGSWSGADNGDPEFKKWNADWDGTGYSHDRNSWAVITAAKNVLETAQQVNNTHPNLNEAWRHMMTAQASDYWYWDGTEIWDSAPTRGTNLAIQLADPIAKSGTDTTPPTIWIPQREAYNPGGKEWEKTQASNPEIWTFAYDMSGISSVKLYYRTDKDGINNLSTKHNETYAGGGDVNEWQVLNMSIVNMPEAKTNPAPLLRAQRYAVTITGLTDVLVDYYVEATDTKGSIKKTDIQHVWIGESSSGGGDTGNSSVTWSPQNPTKDDIITITITNATQGAKLHWGVNPVGSTWQTPHSAYQPIGSTLFGGTGPAVQTPFNGPDAEKKLTLSIGPFNHAAQVVERLAFVLNYNDNTWNNNGGQDFAVTISGNGAPPPTITYTMDGTKDAVATQIASNGGLDLHAHWNGTTLYLASTKAETVGGDVFIFVADSPGALKASPWSKSGHVATWSRFLANEQDNNWAGWFDAAGNTKTGAALKQSSGTILEGSIDIATELGNVPSKIYLAVAKFGNSNAGSLSTQAPAGNGDGNVDATEWVEFTLATATHQENEAVVPMAFFLGSNYPNPFNPTTTIAYSLQKAGEVTLSVYDVTGRIVRTLSKGFQTAGRYQARLDASDLSSGVYFVRLTMEGISQTRNIVLAK
ncbi:MAG TPA: T9SS type A sorting domain-containing protein [Rhodothermales bacterium]|nr:T9SS type A sorting domain-containing protein [Rhodothermales bacterium]